MGKNSKHPKQQQTELSRKDKRKLLRKEKKQKKIFYHSRHNDNMVTHNARPLNGNNNNLIAAKGNKSETTQQNTKAKPQGRRNSSEQTKTAQKSLLNRKQKGDVPIKSVSKKKDPINNSGSDKLKKKSVKSTKEMEDEAQLLREEKEIEYYEKLLGVNKRKSKYKNIAKGLGYDDDLFDFLDNITNKVKTPSGKSSQQGVNQELRNDQQEMDYDNQDDDGMQMNEDYQAGSDEQQNDNYEQDIIDEQDEEEDQEDGQQNDEDDDEQQEISQQQHEEEQYEGEDQQLDEEDADFEEVEGEDDQEGQFLDDEQEMDEQQMNMWNQLQNQEIHIQEEALLKSKSKKQKLQAVDESTKNKSKLNQKSNESYQQKPFKFQQLAASSITPSGRRPLFGNMSQQQKEQQQIRKQMNNIFNKLSDGNLMISFRQFSEVFLSASKSNTIPVFINLFVRFNVEVEKPHLHILLSNVSLASALHHLMGNRLMAPLIYELVKKFDEYEQTEENEEEVQEIGYSKLFEKKKNIVIILSYLYEYRSLTGDFVYSFVKHLAQQLNEHHVEFLYIIIQKIGNKIRQNDPAILKEIIDTLKQSIQTFKSSNTHKENELSKVNIIELELNELRFNRKQPLFSDQRMAFFSTFLSKNIPNELNTQKDILLATFDQVRNANTSLTNWWENLVSNNKQGTNNDYDNEEDLQMISELTAERKQLIQLAKSLHLVTQIRKNIFVEIMEASDYIEATQRVLALKIKNLQEISVVLVQACVLQPTFNPFYPLVAAKIANINPKFKSKVQFTIWDHIKLLESYNARKTSNLAKFTARFIGSPLTNGSLSILKYFADFINIPPHEAMFLMIFFTEFFSYAKKQTLVQISTKLKEEANRQIKDSVLEYLNDVGVREKGFNNMEKMKFLRRAIMINENQNEDGERF